VRVRRHDEVPSWVAFTCRPVSGRIDAAKDTPWLTGRQVSSPRDRSRGSNT
jgi:hypothetical protein